MDPTVAADCLHDCAYGEGMVLIKPAIGHVADASSQSGTWGTWVEQKSVDDQKAKKDSQTRLEMRRHKSRRLDCTTGTTPLCSTLHQSASNSSHGSVSSAVSNDTLVIDNFTVHLGIGWRSISDDGHYQAAARGWARFIENSYGLTGVRICLESKGLQSYLVETSNGYFLFAENLRRGRLVSATAEGALRNLKLSPPQFEGPELDFMAKDNERVDASADSAMALDS
ncbi:hypothetical protein C2857_001511 [Epichloe festucae Fl1]|uniref:Uncharacterized protein n=1 Tax=Epichloe festucae (strain Fl1) TaxID=877507 RepID=A0A7S9KU96_EPIFF|nr:hypothetical protein C2857_001511 [Epichloe festucae Fl1]